MSKEWKKKQRTFSVPEADCRIVRKSSTVLQTEDKTPQDLLNDFSALLASFLNCGLTIVTTNELEYGKYTTVPPLKEGIQMPCQLRLC